MHHRTPRLEIYPDRIAENARTVYALVHGHGAQVAAVGKVTCAHPAVITAMASAGADMVADSRITNLMESSHLGTGLPQMLLRIPAPSAAHDVVRWADITLNSSLQSLQVLSQAAQMAGTTHQAILMIDIGDLREGVWPDMAVDVVVAAAKLPNLELIGVGANLACYGGVIPSPENMQMLIDVRDAARDASGLALELISGGNSSSLPMIANDQMPAEINHFRIGETVALGRNVLDRSAWPGTRQDTFTLVTEIVELERKPSVPIGLRAQNAFGETVEFDDRGRRLRAICNLGRQDTNVDGIVPLDPGISVIGASSDHLILDVEDAVYPVALGAEVSFVPNYGALLGLSTSAYVDKVVRRG
ncbi:alanine racemase [Gephyromycinifex aptenodytis]|uniref:alanine racemase n=1 Tax=Gephyromycinifex aptenodytis TaxID=2716227 RepID=UPI0014460DB6|nr:alanine/ornithine racemase family PLP-dependent enzyme [Gephyromycinifex aptenodytis]